MANQPSRFIALDLEMNQPSGRIIQVGICIGDRLQSEDEYLFRQWLVNPGEPLAPEITKLTGITEEMISDEAVSLVQIAHELEMLLQDNPCFMNPITWGGGDVELLLNAFKESGIEFPHFGRRWLDVKTLHVFQRLTLGKSTSGGLRSVMQQYQMKFVGQPHRAHIDAYNTLRLFFKLMERQSTFETIAFLGKRV